MFTEDLDAFFGTADFALEAKYKPATGTARTVRVLFDQPGLDTMGINATDVSILVKSSDLEGFSNRDTIVISGVTYRITAQQPVDDGALNRFQLEKQ
jgi:hypothetical protein